MANVTSLGYELNDRLSSAIAAEVTGPGANKFLLQLQTHSAHRVNSSPPFPYPVLHSQLPSCIYPHTRAITVVHFLQPFRDHSNVLLCLVFWRERHRTFFDHESHDFVENISSGL